MDDKDIRMAAWMDQHDAATAHAREIMGAVAENATENEIQMAISMPFHETFIGKRHFSWMSTPESFRDSDILRCQHIDVRNPSIWCVNILESNRLMCLECAVFHTDELVKERPNECDCCGVGNVAEFHEVLVQVGNVLVAGNICPGCMREQSNSYESWNK